MKFMSEESFKKWYLPELVRVGKYNSYENIETESTVPGFPDTLAKFPGDSRMFDLLEFKVSNARNEIKFKRSQPGFYLRHKTWPIYIVAWSNIDNCVHWIEQRDLFQKDSSFCLSGLVVKLPRSEANF